jgi:hypothetical protein
VEDTSYLPHFESMVEIKRKLDNALIELAEIMNKHRLSFRISKVAGSNEFIFEINHGLDDNYDARVDYTDCDIANVFIKCGKSSEDLIIKPVQLIMN